MEAFVRTSHIPARLLPLAELPKSVKKHLPIYGHSTMPPVTVPGTWYDVADHFNAKLGYAGTTKAFSSQQVRHRDGGGALGLPPMR